MPRLVRCAGTASTAGDIARIRELAENTKSSSDVESSTMTQLGRYEPALDQEFYGVRQVQNKNPLQWVLGLLRTLWISYSRCFEEGRVSGVQDSSPVVSNSIGNRPLTCTQQLSYHTCGFYSAPDSKTRIKVTPDKGRSQEVAHEKE